ncbi:MAG: hypothetical protein PF630_00445 [Gammaproteobacteria bacterium]|jgi:uncharacterized integral membrane protein|nr:hypothetical protein [Gammaproteobacteria bacterium]
MYHWFVLIAVVLAVLFGLAIGVLNPTEIDFNLVVAKWTTSTGMLFTLTLVGGLLAGALLVWITRVLPLQYKLRKSKRAATPETAESRLSGNHNKPQS